MPHIALGDVTQYYEEQGRGQPVLFLHHYFGTLASWQAQRDALGRYYRVLAIDLRGHGRSTSPAGRITLEGLGGDVASLIEQLDLGSVHVVGASQGGLVALHLARHRPELVHSLTVVNPPAVTEASALDYADRFIQEIFPANEERFAREHPEQAPGHVRDVLLHNFALDRARYPAAMIDALERANEIERPCLVVAADNDPVFPVTRAVELVHAMPRAELCVLPRGTHLPHRAMPAIFVAILIDFLRRVG